MENNENEKRGCATITLDVQVRMQTFDEKNQPLDALALGAKLTKADAGRWPSKFAEDWFTVRIEPSISSEGMFGTPKVETSYHSKEGEPLCNK